MHSVLGDTTAVESTKFERERVEEEDEEVTTKKTSMTSRVLMYNF